MSSSIKLRKMNADDLPSTLALTQAEKWPHQAKDWAFHFEVGQGWVAELDGKVVASTLLWVYGEEPKIATVGLIVVNQACQGQGIGRQLLQTAIDACPAEELRLVATQAGIKLYQRNGFNKTGLIRQCQGEPDTNLAVDVPEGLELNSLKLDDLEEIVALDEKAFGCSRRNLLEPLLNSANGMALRKNGLIQSFALLREGGRGLQFGPIVGTSIEECQCLIAALLPKDGRFTRIDITDHAEHLLPWLDSIGLKQVDEVSAMTRISDGSPKENPFKDPNVHSFALVSQAFA